MMILINDEIFWWLIDWLMRLMSIVILMIWWWRLIDWWLIQLDWLRSYPDELMMFDWWLRMFDFDDWWWWLIDDWLDWLIDLWFHFRCLRDLIVILMIDRWMQWWMIDDRWMIVGLIDFEKMIDDRLCNSKEQWETGNSFERGMFRWFGNLVTHSRQKEPNIEIWYHVITWFTPWYCKYELSIYDRMKILIYIYIS